MSSRSIKNAFAVVLMLAIAITSLWASASEEEGGETTTVDRQMVRDPTTGEMVPAPQYGGTFTYAMKIQPASIDPYYRYSAGVAIGLVAEKPGMGNWAMSRDTFDFASTYVPEVALTGRLIESWEQTDPRTYVLNVRQGVRWHDKPPMNGRQLVASDIEYNFHRILGIGSGFTEPSADPALQDLKLIPLESITATDDWTVVVKLEEPFPDTLRSLFISKHSYILPPEVIEQYGSMEDWRNVVGTGPYMLDDWVDGSSISYVRNPDYWGFDEKFPENQLPYIENIRALMMTEDATILAGLRSGTIDYIGFPGDSQLISIDQAQSLQRTNPDIVLHPYSWRAETSMMVDVQREPWNDVRVRKALNMALDLDTINATYFSGLADTVYNGHLGNALVGYQVPFDQWPEELQAEYTYNPELAEQLLDEAGYPRGEDGVRFRTDYGHYEFFDLDFYLTALEYFKEIGIEVEAHIVDRATHITDIREHLYEGLKTTVTNADDPPLGLLSQPWSGSVGWNPPNANDPEYDALYEAAVAATTVEELQEWAQKAHMYIAENHWWIRGPKVPSFNVAQPWVMGYNGEIELGSTDRTLIFSRLWIDESLK